jgi:hypothetical protein
VHRAGVVDEVVDPSVLTQDLVDDPLAVTRVADVAWCSDIVRPLSLASLAKASAAWVSRLYSAAILAPCCASWLEMAAPMPRVPPVTRATRSFMSFTVPPDH